MQNSTVLSQSGSKHLHIIPLFAVLYQLNQLALHKNTVIRHAGQVAPLLCKHTHTQRQKHTLTGVHTDITRAPCVVKNAARPAGAVS